MNFFTNLLLANSDGPPFPLGLRADLRQICAMTRLIQICQGNSRRVTVVEEPRVRLLAAEVGSVYALAMEAIAKGKKLEELISEKAPNETLDYEPIYKRQSLGKLLPPLDHPEEPARSARGLSGCGCGCGWPTSTATGCFR
jgi:hypothetical protein